MHDVYRCGNCGDLSIPVYKPNTAYTRKRIGDKLDYLNANGARWIGCLTSTSTHDKQCVDQAAVIASDWRLRLHIRGEELDLGLPKSRPDDANEKAAVWRWYWPDLFAA